MAHPVEKSGLSERSQTIERTQSSTKSAQRISAAILHELFAEKKHSGISTRNTPVPNPHPRQSKEDARQENADEEQEQQDSEEFGPIQSFGTASLSKLYTYEITPMLQRPWYNHSIFVAPCTKGTCICLALAIVGLSHVGTSPPASLQQRHVYLHAATASKRVGGKASGGK